MKKIILTLITLIVPLLAISQDVIVKMDGNEILAKVLEINDEEIKYKIFSNQDGPLHVIKKSDVLEIKYPNGTTEIINEEQEGSNKNNNKHDSKIVRVGSSYYQNSRPLSYPAVTKILGESNNIEISENWRKGNSQKATSTPLIAVGVPLVAGAITSGILLGYDILDFELEGNPLFYLCVIGGSAGIFLTSYGSFLTASPIISILLTIALFNVSSLIISSKVSRLNLLRYSISIVICLRTSIAS